MKIHRPIGLSIIEALHDVFVGGYYADKVIERAFKNNRKWGSRDRRFFAESVYEIVRWWRYLRALAGVEESMDTGPTQPQLWKVFAAHLINRDTSLPDWPELSNLDVQEVRARREQNRFSRAVRQSYPDWMDARFAHELGERWDLLSAVLNEAAPVTLRVNRLKTSREELIKALREEDIEARPVSPDFPDALVLVERANVFKTQAFRRGLFEVQDAGSQKIAPLLRAEPGQTVIDACAGAGGKTLHLAALMENKGRIISMDIHGHKLEQLRLRSRRNGVHNVEIRAIESAKTIKRLADRADAVLLDVPCSGSGVIRRNPDTKWKLTEERLLELAAIQTDILNRYSKMVKPSGCMVYATCSVLPSENEGQVARFLSDHPEFQLEEEMSTAPEERLSDGFYAARMRRAR